MCGIFGRFAYDGRLTRLTDLADATNVLAHRGPDDGTWWTDGPFFLGHRRLSIIDPGTGQQPMATPDGRYVVVFNGEIYNYVELRDELRHEGLSFTTQSDTEVILNGYRAWGNDLPRRLIGMFAFAIVDRVDRRLFLARDRFGEKPLFIAETQGAVSFASEISAIAAMPDFDPEVEMSALSGYLCLNYVPGDLTMLRGVTRLRPGTWRAYDGRTVTTDEYWNPRTTIPVPAGDDTELRLRLRERIDRSVRIALRSDVPVALFLSGGIDSSVIAESAVRQGQLRHAYCLDFPEAGFSELPNASRVANSLGLELRRVVFSLDTLREFSEIVAHADDPLADSSAVAVWALSKAAAKDYKVVISGDGGDELFGGYLTYKATAIHQFLCRLLPNGMRRTVQGLASHLRVNDSKVSSRYKLMRFLRAFDLPPQEAHFTWNGSWLPNEAASFIRDAAQSKKTSNVFTDICQELQLTESADLKALQCADIANYLPNDILTKMDRMTMAHGLEARAPFLMPDIAEFALALPNRLKLRTLGQPKRILRQVARDLYGNTIAAAKKQGFSIPVHRWLRGPMRDTVEDLLCPRSLASIDVIDTDAVLKAKKLHMDGKAQLGFELWGLMVLVCWHRQRIQARPLPSSSASLRRIYIPRDETVRV